MKRPGGESVSMVMRVFCPSLEVVRGTVSGPKRVALPA
jgi:hypothetical protein